MFEILDLERAEQDHFEGRIAFAADKAAASVDRETIAMYVRYGIPLPKRLAKIAQDSYIR